MAKKCHPRSGFESDVRWLMAEMVKYLPSKANALPPKQTHPDGTRLVYRPSGAFVRESQILGEVEKRTRTTDNLNPLCTREVFRLAAAGAITNNRLLDILHRLPPGTRKGRENSTLIRVLRDATTVRTLKLKQARYIVLRLLSEGFVSNSDAVKTWYFCVVNYSLMQAVRRSPAKMATPIQELVASSQAICENTLRTFFENSKPPYEANKRGSQHAMFLDDATAFYFAEDATERNLVDNKKRLAELALEFDRYLLHETA